MKFTIWQGVVIFLAALLLLFAPQNRVLSPSSSSTEDVYVACGCGCCGGVEIDDVNVTCLYPSRGDSLEKIIAADKKFGTSGICEFAGCSFPIRYQICE